MRSLEDINGDITKAKEHKKQAKKDFGKVSHEYVEACEDLDALKQELQFHLDHY